MNRAWRAAGVACALALVAAVPARADLQLGDVMPAIVYLHGISRAGEQPTVLSGTGFFVSRDDEYFIVTAQHVAQALPAETLATFRGANGEAVTLQLFGMRADPAAWVWHPEADVAAMRVTLPVADATPGATPSPAASIRAIAFDQLVKRAEAPAIDTVLTVIGFPLSIATSGAFSPIVRSAHPSSDVFRHDRFDKQIETSLFVVDDPAIAAFAGAPVLQLPYVRSAGVGVWQTKFACFGLVHGALTDRTGGKLAAIVPAIYIADTVRLASRVANRPNRDQGN
jgi:hypothetical protein